MAPPADRVREPARISRFAPASDSWSSIVDVDAILTVPAELLPVVTRPTGNAPMLCMYILSLLAEVSASNRVDAVTSSFVPDAPISPPVPLVVNLTEAPTMSAVPSVAGPVIPPLTASRSISPLPALIPPSPATAASPITTPPPSSSI